MANKQNFTPEEWNQVLESIMLTGIAVSAADPSGLWGTLKEAFASSSALSASKRDPGSSELIKAAVADFETPQGRTVVQQALRKRCGDAEPAELVQRSLACLRDVSRILDAKAPGEAPAFKAWLRDISQKVADASVEGAFLGFGGQRVSDAEKATLDDIAKSLGVTA
jgi:hypothetical protein